MLWIHGEDDQLVAIEATRAGIDHLRGSTYVERIYPGARHELFNETNKEEVTGDVLAFIRKHVTRS